MSNSAIDMATGLRTDQLYRLTEVLAQRTGRASVPRDRSPTTAKAVRLQNLRREFKDVVGSEPPRHVVDKLLAGGLR